MFYKVTAAFILAALSTSAHATAFPSLSCSFTEPFVTINTFPGGMLVIRPEGTARATRMTLSGSNREPVISAKLGSDSMRLGVVNTPGNDGMSDFESPLTGQLVSTDAAGVASRVLSGMCLPFPDGTTPRPVTGVTDNDPLNVRARSHARGRIIAKLAPNMTFWAYPEPLVRGWARGAIAKYPEGGSGRVTIVDGWVSARYLGVMAP